MAPEAFQKELADFVSYLEEHVLAGRRESVDHWFEGEVGLNIRTLSRWKTGRLPSRDHWNDFMVAARNLGHGIEGFGERVEHLKACLKAERERRRHLQNGYFVGTETATTSKGFVVLTDGMIVSSAAELIQDDDQTRDVRKLCRRSYQRSLEDLAFALVYGSKVATSSDFRPSFSKPGSPAKELMGRLGEISEIHMMDDDLRDGALLKQPATFRAIEEDMRRFAACLKDGRYLPYFREYLGREARIHLGSDGSLFREEMDPSSYQYDTKRPYYTDRVLQNALGQEATATLVSFLPESPEKLGDRYARKALEEFATRNVLSLLTIDREYDESARRTRKWRMPHVLRSLLKRNAVERMLMEQQEYLREIATTNALAAAFGKTLRDGRRRLITVLIDLRDISPFRQVREVLEHEDLMVLQPGRGKEEKACRIIKLISSFAKQDLGRIDNFLLSRRSALRRLEPLQAGQYERELYRVFPELKPSPDLVE